jgi:hypothetical protein
MRACDCSGTTQRTQPRRLVVGLGPACCARVHTIQYHAARSFGTPSSRSRRVLRCVRAVRMPSGKRRTRSSCRVRFDACRSEATLAGLGAGAPWAHAQTLGISAEVLRGPLQTPVRSKQTPFHVCIVCGQAFAKMRRPWSAETLRSPESARPSRGAAAPTLTPRMPPMPLRRLGCGSVLSSRL